MKRKHLGRKKSLIGTPTWDARRTAEQSTPEVMPHDEFIDRIRKSFYFGYGSTQEDMVVSLPLAEYASELFSEPHKGHSLNRLNAVEAGNVHAPTCSLIMALIYLERLNTIDPVYVRRITPQELFIVAMMISTKFYAGHDEEIFLSDWAEDGNMCVERLKEMEIEFLMALNWNAHVSNEEFFAKLNSIERILAKREGLRRGWFTYTELAKLLPTITLIKYLLTPIAVMAVSYVAGVMTIAGAFHTATQIPGNAMYCGKNMALAPGIINGGIILPTPSTMDLTQQMQPRRMQNVTAKNGTKLHAKAVAQTRRMYNNPAEDSDQAMDIDECELFMLNAQEELLKLEQQYQAEAIREIARLRQNEIKSFFRLMLPDVLECKLGNLERKHSDCTRTEARYRIGDCLNIKSKYQQLCTALKRHQQLEKLCRLQLCLGKNMAKTLQPEYLKNLLTQMQINNREQSVCKRLKMQLIILLKQKYPTLSPLTLEYTTMMIMGTAGNDTTAPNLYWQYLRDNYTDCLLCMHSVMINKRI